LIIGYGNDLRGDDGIGPWVAEQIEARHLPAVRTCAVHQLTPELSLALSSAKFAVFVDAWRVEYLEETPRVRRLSADASQWRGAHFAEPEALLSMARTLFGSNPIAWAVDVPAFQFDHSDSLSKPAQTAAMKAIDLIVDMIASEAWDHRECMKSA
jgi:hydrogenase maturation protease